MNANRTNQFSYPSAFSRNIGQGTLNLSQQKKLKGAKIALVGLGGLGCAALSNLVRAGVENFWLCDFDVFEVSNLNRQAFATAKNLGDYKVDAAKEFVLSVNPGANVQTSRKKLDEKLAKSMCNWADVVLDCLDNPYPKVVLARAAKSAKKPLVFGSASGVYGMSCMFACDRNEEFKGKGSSTIANNVSDMEKILKLPSYGEGLDKAQKLLKDGWECKSVLGTVPNLIGTMQAQMAINCLLGKPVVSVPEFLIFDASENGFFSIKRLG